MKTISLAFVSIVLAVGCKKSGPDCAKAIDRGLELSKSGAEMKGLDDQTLAKMRELGIQHCQDDKWPDDAVQCIIDAKELPAAQACYGKLSAEQRGKMQAAAKDMKPKAEPAPAPDTGSGSAH